MSTGQTADGPGPGEDVPASRVPTRGRSDGMAVTDRPEVVVRASLEDPEHPVIGLAGELDLASVEATRAGIYRYLTTTPTRLTFDLGEVTFMDSSGIALLVQLANDVGTVTLVHVPPIVHRVLEATGLLEFFGLLP
jgi:anti-anti-sigma factor